MAVRPEEVSAVLVTRGDVDMGPVLNSLPFDDVILWDNSVEADLQCYGRFAAISRAKHEIIYTQDDDILVPIPALLDEYDGNGADAQGILANRKPDEEYRFLGIGSLFHRDLVDVFDKYLAVHPVDKDFHRAADVVFAELNDYRSVWLGYAELEWSRYENRMYKQPGHYEARDNLIARARAL